MNVLRRLWRDEAGFVISSELVLVATILVIGMIVGLTSLRDQVVQELVDVGQAIGSISQTYSYDGINGPNAAMTDGSAYTDALDFGQNVQTSGLSPGGINLQVVPSGGDQSKTL